jgi:RNA polymerase primary sigma factor
MPREAARPTRSGRTIDYHDPAATPRLTREEERELGRRSLAGDLDARNELVRRNVHLVVHLAKNRPRWCRDDLTQQGMLGLIRAADKYDPEEYPDVRFGSYAATWINQFMSRGMDSMVAVHVPAYLYFGGKGDPDRRAEYRSKAAVAQQGTASLDTFDVDDPAYQLADHRARNASEAVEIADEIRVMMSAIRRLSHRSAEVIRLRAGIGCRPHGMEAIGEQLGITRERVRQIEKEALQKVAAVLGSDQPPDSIGYYNHNRKMKGATK